MAKASHNKKKCYYYKCKVNSFDEEVEDGILSLFTIPRKYEMERKKEFLVRMNIANFETKIPFLNHLRICSKHFKEEDFQYIICRSPHKTRRLLPNALPTDWRDVYPEEVELSEARTSFRPGDDIIEYIDEQREYTSGSKVKIEHDYAREECPDLIPSYVTRKDAELVRYVRASLSENGDIIALQGQGGFYQVPTGNGAHPVSTLTEQQPTEIEPSSPIQGEVVEESADLMDNEDATEWDQEIVLQIPKNKMCRLCGQQARNMVQIFGMDGLDMLLAEKINSFLPIHVIESDDLPHQACISCIEQVTSACKLFSRVTKVNKSLLKMYGSSDERNARKTQDPIKSIMDSVGIDENDCNDNDDGPNAFDDDEMESEPCQFFEPDLFPIANDEDLLEADEEYLDASMYDAAFESSKDLEFEPKYEQLLCAECNVVVSNITDYLDHQAVVHGRSLVHCPLCIVFFSNFSELRQHWRDLHSRDFRANNVDPKNKILMKVYANVGSKAEPLWKCGMCQESFSSIIEFRKNKRRCAKKKVAQLKKQEKLKLAPNTPPKNGDIHLRYKCDYCDERFVNRNKRFSHMLSTHKEFKPYECNICKKLFKVKKCYDGHMVTHSIGKSYLCTTCGKMFSSPDTLRSHQRTHMAKVPCPICKLMKKPDQLKLHLRQHKMHKVKKPVCLICQKTYMDELHYNSHLCTGPAGENPKAIVGMEPGTNAFLCSDCESTFATPDTYMKHLRQTHPEVDKYMYTCSVCREQSPILHQLSIHLETHKECLRYSCQLCPRQFSTAKRRVSHEVSKHKTQKCPHCEKTLTAQFYRDHLNLHTGEKPYHCSICNLHFKSKVSIMLHMNRHSDNPEKSLKCTICGSQQTTKGNLQIHIKSHTTDEPSEQCDYCDKKFWNKRQLMMHRRFHTSSQVFKCQLCDYACIHAKSLRNHMRKNHANCVEEQVVEEEVSTSNDL